MKTFKKIFLYTLAGFALIQLIPTDKINQPVDRRVNFTDVNKTPGKIAGLLKGACYDCHSNETVYPDYAYIAPVSWSVKSHVNEGREHMNLSVWNTYNKDLKESMLTQSIQTLRNRSMPMPGYIVYHREANLSDAERALLVQYFEGLLESKSY